MEFLRKKSDNSVWIVTGKELIHAMRASRFASQFGTRTEIVAMEELDTGNLFEFHCCEIPSDWEEVKRVKSCFARSFLFLANRGFAFLLRAKYDYENNKHPRSQEAKRLNALSEAMLATSNHFMLEGEEAKQKLTARLSESLGILSNRMTFWEYLRQWVMPEHQTEFAKFADGIDVSYVVRDSSVMLDILDDYSLPAESEFDTWDP